MVAGESAFRVGFCVSGQGRLFRAAVQHHAQLGIAPVLVVTDKPKVGDLDEFCAAAGLPLVRLAGMDRPSFDRRLTEVCRDARLDLLCLSFDKILPPELVSLYRDRIINVHTSLLPAFAGRAPTERTVASGARFGGATIHVVTDDVDGGPIIAQCVLGIRADEQPAALADRMFGLMRLMYLQVLTWFAARRVTWREGQVWIRDAVYGELPISPAVELSFAD